MGERLRLVRLGVSARRRRKPGSRHRFRRRALVFVLGVGIIAAVGLVSKGHVTRPVARRLSAAPTAGRPSSPVPGFLLIADRGNNRMLLLDAEHRMRWHFPTAGDLRLGRRLRYNDDGFVAAGGRQVVSNEEDAHTIVSVDVKTHERLHLFGRPGVKGRGAHLLNTPDDAYPLPDGSIIVADAYNCRILKIANHAIVRHWGDGQCRHDPPRSFGALNGDTPLPDGGMLVSEIPGAWIDELAPDGSLRFAIQPPLRYPSDPQLLDHGAILVADYSDPGQVLVVDTHGNILWRYGPASGSGRLNHPSLALPLPGGDIAVNDDYRHRVVVIDPATRRIVWQYGHTDVPGKATGFLNTPDGIDFVPAGPDGQPLWSAVHHPGPPAVLRGVTTGSAAPGTAKAPGASSRHVIATPLAPLPFAIQDAGVAAESTATAVLAGGIQPNNASRASFETLPGSGGGGTLPHRVHDTAMVNLGGTTYLFGGGDAVSYSQIVQLDPGSGTSHPVGSLPGPRSDLAAVGVGGTAYLIGGHDGSAALDTILAWRPGASARVVARLPVGVRYPAAAATADGRVIIAGGSVAGGASRSILSFDPATATVTLIGTLPTPLTHAAAATLGSSVYLIGGRGAAAESATAEILAIDPATGTTTRVGQLPAPTSDAAAVTLGNRILLIGGRSNARAVASVVAITP